MTTIITGTCNFVNFTKACDYYRAQLCNDELTPADLESLVCLKIGDSEIDIGKPDLPVGGKLILLDHGTRYGIEQIVG